eukprot:TRINITY_DN662_c2_g2_i6.p1 TRINITY_DN662_c2_g2~~TRINITY_DN662_c2_g2_i6.p1  ORF type:complete len:746 (-),score=140.35 TRINITY_DN662_c2_g2_i6:224-2461(-)
MIRPNCITVLCAIVPYSAPLRAGVARRFLPFSAAMAPITDKVGARKARAARAREEELRRNRPLPLGFLISTIERSVKSETLTRDMLFYVPFLVAYLLFVMLGTDVFQAYYVTASIEARVGQATVPPPSADSPGAPFWGMVFEDIRDAPGLSYWLAGVAFPAVFFDGTNAPFEYVAGSATLIGALRLRTLRVRNDSCSPDSAFVPSDSQLALTSCFASWSGGTAAKAPYGGKNGTAFKYINCGHVTAARLHSYPCEGYAIDIPFSKTPIDVALGQLQQALDDGFIDNFATRLVVFEFFTYTPALDVFSSAKFAVEVAEGGYWLPSMHIRHFPIWTKRLQTAFAFEIIVLIYMAYYLAQFLYLWVVHVRTRGGAVLSYLLDVWHMLDVISFVFFGLVFGYRFTWLSESKALTLPVQKYVYPVELEKIVGLYYTQNWLRSFTTILVFLKLLNFLQLNDQLNILTRTLENAQSHIIGVLVLFLMVLFAFAITGTTLFGSAIEEYKDINTAASTLMRTLLGNFDYQAMRSEQPFLAGLFFWSFVVIALFVLLNFIIAVIAQAFAEENAKTKQFPLDQQLTRQFKNVLRALYNSENWGKDVLTLFQRSRRQRRTTILQYLIEYQRELLRDWKENNAEHKDSDIDALNADQDVKNTWITRADLQMLMPLAEYHYVGEEWLALLWEDVVFEYELLKHHEAEEEERREYATVRDGIKEVMEPLFTRKDKYAPQVFKEKAANWRARLAERRYLPE